MTTEQVQIANGLQSQIDSLEAKADTLESFLNASNEERNLTLGVFLEGAFYAEESIGIDAHITESITRQLLTLQSEIEVLKAALARL